MFNCLPRVNALDVRANLPHMEQSLLKFKGNGTEKTEVVQLVDGKGDTVLGRLFFLRKTQDMMMPKMSFSQESAVR